MKRTFSILTLFAFITLPAHASVTLSTQFGVAYDSAGVAVPDGALWALVVDTNNDHTFTGFGLNSSLYQSMDAFSFFTFGQSLSVGSMLGGDTIFALGGFNGTFNGLTGISVGEINITYGANGTAAGLNFAFFWFPDAVFTGGASETLGCQYGGIHTSSADGIFDSGMVLPPDGSFVSVGAATSGDAGGSQTDSSFSATSLLLCPEPSTFLLSVLGFATILRRRRN